jgi:hypothetical protein
VGDCRGGALPSARDACHLQTESPGDVNVNVYSLGLPNATGEQHVYSAIWDMPMLRCVYKYKVLGEPGQCPQQTSKYECQRGRGRQDPSATANRTQRVHAPLFPKPRNWDGDQCGEKAPPPTTPPQPTRHKHVQP